MQVCDVYRYSIRLEIIRFFFVSLIFWKVAIEAKKTRSELISNFGTISNSSKQTAAEFIRNVCACGFRQIY